MKIMVTREDIEGGRRYDPVRCPVARALRRAGMVFFTVMESAVRLRDEDEHGGLLVLPGSVQNWIRDFDRGEPVEPMHFELEALWDPPRGFVPKPANIRFGENRAENQEEEPLLPPLPEAERECLLEIA
jgi:hypothetical protein